MFCRGHQGLNSLVAIATALLLMGAPNARAEDKCVIAVGDGVPLYEEPDSDSDVIAWFDTGAKFYMTGQEDGGFVQLQYVRDLNGRDVIGWMTSGNLEYSYNCNFNLQTRRLGTR
jgi:hypothetical protein